MHGDDKTVLPFEHIVHRVHTYHDMRYGVYRVDMQLSVPEVYFI